MIEAPALPFLRRGRKRPPADGGEHPSPPGASNVEPIEIVAPDRYCTAVLLEYAGRSFPAEIVAGPGWVVRLQPPARPEWVFELLALVERWLEYAGLPCAKVRYSGRSYLIGAPGGTARPIPTD